MDEYWKTSDGYFKRESPERYLLQAFGAGLLATIAMSIVLDPLASASGLSPLNLSPLLGSLLSIEKVGPTPGSLYSLGMLEHIINGALLFPLFFVLIGSGALNLLSSQRAVQGLLFGVLLWLLFQTVFAPIAGLGFFSVKAADPVSLLFVSFNGHVIYGLLLGLLAPKGKLIVLTTKERTPFEESKKAAA